MATQSHAVAHHRAASTCGGRRHGLDSRHNPTIPSAKASHGDTHLLNQSASRAAIYSDPFRNPPCSRPLKVGFQPWFPPSRRPYPEPSIFVDSRPTNGGHSPSARRWRIRPLARQQQNAGQPPSPGPRQAAPPSHRADYRRQACGRTPHRDRARRRPCAACRNH